MLALTLGAAGIYLWLGPQRSTSASSTAVESTFPLETFVVNLSGNLNGSSQRAYLRVGITLGLAHPLPRNPAEATPTAAVRDTILSVLATAQPDEMLKAEGKRQLKDDPCEPCRNECRNWRSRMCTSPNFWFRCKRCKMHTVPMQMMRTEIFRLSIARTQKRQG